MQRVRKQVGLKEDSFSWDGTGIVVAVLDTGVGMHPDLDGKVLAFRDFVNGRQVSYDDSGHGTHVCGILCGSGGLSEGRYRGMAPGARLVVGKVLDAKGDGETENMIEGLEWILAQRDRYRIRILNISVGIGALDDRLKEAALMRKLEQLWDEGILVVCAAGNKGPRNNSIASIGGNGRVVTVGCHDGAYFRDHPGRCETYSGRGDPNGRMRKPDLVAPGTEIVSCNVHCRETRNGYRNAYLAKSGTSMATPVVSGAAALLMQGDPGMTNEECRDRLLFTCTDLGLPWNRQGFGMVNVGWLQG